MTPIRSAFLDALKSGTSGTVLADGGIGSLIFQLTGRLASAEYAYEALNLDNRELIRSIHVSSLAAGATVLTTNTFAANTAELEAARVGGNVGARVGEINRAAVEIARDAIADHKAEYPAAEPNYFVVGSIGPGGRTVEAYAEQIDALIGAGVDALLLETFTDIELAMQLTRFISSRPEAPPVIVHGALDPGVGETQKWPIEPVEFVNMAAEAGASVAGINCVAPWAAAAFITEARAASAVASGEILLSAMPNAGGFERIGHRFLARANPEYMGTLARQLGDSGASLVGGCCEVHPEHIREMSAYLKSRRSSLEPMAQEAPGPPGAAGASVSGARSKAAAAVRDKSEKRRANGEFSRKLFDGEFVVSVEVVAPPGTESKALDLRAKMVSQLVEEGLADAVDITDGSRGMPLVPPGDLVELIRQKLDWHDGDKLEFIAHFTGRDLNTLAVQSRLMGYYWRGLKNVLFITGDPPKMSPTYPRSTAVFDMDSVQMIRATAGQLNQGRDFGGNPLGGEFASGAGFTVGTGFEPEAINMSRELDRLRAKIDSGADYVMTQPVFGSGLLSVIEPLRDSISVLPGVLVLRSADHARRIAQVPGVNLPVGVLEELDRFNSPADQAKVGLDLAVSRARAYRSDGWSGLYLMSPASLGAAVAVLKALAE
ncbi:MAG: homocysteine S-methyltransferase family protein [Chloroflexi bacterium]|nr:homocysteine S-methyltransferase family protein [Chloroflexota bacterium]MCI0775404.1 homocysteine S-methyltransferase family protein [Chloroflexota bacterium]MCI0836879.1 homocysteine S-methyltransferase family protein [Chloroflexota bacterium]MCI0870387.1 homocysteine S-methyltransferase family protein [Chloroflexota bacterium]MCI0872643.1 homocysteine S-methyltransferase family protein [Chloroflexota bacterium]